ncbi:MAG TPA: hypothetical protein VMC09_09135 [Anaerolineales bacterium]|nr:hypothetical protein [Anaerolineales bacterium]
MKSRRFRPSAWSKWLVPFLIGLLLLAMLSTFVLVALSVFGYKFG